MYGDDGHPFGNAMTVNPPGLPTSFHCVGEVTVRVLRWRCRNRAVCGGVTYPGKRVRRTVATRREACRGKSGLHREKVLGNTQAGRPDG